MNGATLDSAMNAKEKLLEQLPHWTEGQAARALAAAEGEAVPDEPVVGDIRNNPLVPESMHFFDSGRPQPDWAAAVRRSRLGH